MSNGIERGDARVEAAAKALLARRELKLEDLTDKAREHYLADVCAVLAAADAADQRSRYCPECEARGRADAVGGEAPGDAATVAGLESACGHLSALVDATTLLLRNLRDYTNDLHENRCLGGGPEHGEVPLLDRVDDWLEQRVIPAPSAPAVPDGYALVPVEPTPAMLDALRTGSRKDWPSDELCRVRYAALIAAATSQNGAINEHE